MLQVIIILFMVYKQQKLFTILLYLLYVNISILTSDHSLFKDHMKKISLAGQKSMVIVRLKWQWRNFAPFKISLSVLYSMMWIWGLTGNILYNI